MGDCDSDGNDDGDSNGVRVGDGNGNGKEYGHGKGNHEGRVASREEVVAKQLLMVNPS